MEVEVLGMGILTLKVPFITPTPSFIEGATQNEARLI